MAGKEDYRIFVGGLSWNVTERQLENAFSRFGKVLESQVNEPVFRFNNWKSG
ncbi:hypothetical protein TIFTF001_022048 [Ficus carica]|uniref:RRM domain-containing protein n=1 Tax=Ficus carica TaxID=3494 RepID=A0AA88AZ99_FICCA|nr:hypothetical protein TIFTF001_022048 [Ficus carica]